MHRCIVGVIGPTNLEGLSNDTGRPVDFLMSQAKDAGRIVAESGSELWINADDSGMPFLAAKSYTESSGVRLVVLVPKRGVPWPHARSELAQSMADKVRYERNWWWANYNQVTRTEVVICLGLSHGTACELGNAGFNHRLNVSHSLCKLIAVRALLEEERMPNWLGRGLPLSYVEYANELQGQL